MKGLTVPLKELALAADQEQTLRHRELGRFVDLPANDRVGPSHHCLNRYFAAFEIFEGRCPLRCAVITKFTLTCTLQEMNATMFVRLGYHLRAVTSSEPNRNVSSPTKTGCDSQKEVPSCNYRIAIFGRQTCSCERKVDQRKSKINQNFHIALRRNMSPSSEKTKLQIVS
jgi:hypothetical protein